MLGLLCACTQPVVQAPGCRSSENVGNGTDPPSHCLFFPSGLAMDPLGDVLYASNTNADLSFGGGTVVAIDVLRHERAVQCFRCTQASCADLDAAREARCVQASCQGCGQAVCPPRDLNASIEQSDRDAPPSEADYDRCYCEPDLSDRSVVNCESFRFVLRDQSVKIGNFSGPVHLSAEDPSDWDMPMRGGFSLRRTLYLPVRGDPSLTSIDVQRTLGDLSAPRPEGEPVQIAHKVQMSCGPSQAGASIASCSDDHRVQHGQVDPLDFSQLSRLNNPLPAEPFGLVLDRGCRPGYTPLVLTDGAGREQRTLACAPAGMGNADPAGLYQYLVMTHLAGGEISAFNLVPVLSPAPGALLTQITLTNILPPLVPADSAGHRGAFATAPRIPGDLSQPWYVTFRVNGTIATFRLSDAGFLGGPLPVPGQNFGITSAYPTGLDVRDLIFEPGGNRAFMSVDNPPSLTVLDTRPDPNAMDHGMAAGTPINQVISVTDLCPGPSRMALSRTPLSRPGAPPSLQTLLYVACYQTGQMAIADPDEGRLLGTVQIGGGPVTTVLSYGDAVDPCVDPFVGDKEAAQRRVYCPPQNGLRLQVKDPKDGSVRDLPPRAFVTAYLDNAIGVIDLDPGSRTYQRLVSRIGLPLPKTSQ